MTINATSEQLNAIHATEGYIRCGAVPGSGKTYCITKRMAFLITDLYVDPSSIVALTFTNKAASSMTRRLKKMIGDDATCFTGTFHGYCNKILKEEIYRLSYPKEFTILDAKDQMDLIREIAMELNISLKDNTAKDFKDYIDQQKIGGGYISPYMAGADKTHLIAAMSAAGNDFAKVWFRYLLKQRDNYVLDFNDMIEFALHILENYPDALDKWQEKCMYVLCDEFQDVSNRQEHLLELLSGKYHNLTVVGDDDQCIYGWRGSKVDYIVNFHLKYPKAKDFPLPENFRSTPEIIAAANTLIAKNQNRLAKHMYTNNPSGQKPVYNNLKTEKDEADWIADTVLADVSQGKHYSDHAVLVRASSQARALEESFIRKKVPYKILSGAEFYGSEEIKTVLAYLRMVYSLNNLDFTYTIQRPRRGYGKKFKESLETYAEQRNLPLIVALGEQINNGMIKGKPEIIKYYNDIMALHNTYHKYSSKDLANMVLDFGYRAALQQDVEQQRLDNVSELLETIAALERENGEALALDELLSHFALFSQQDDDTDKDVVKVMTIHTAKGLEFDTVFVNGLVEGQFPSRKIKRQEEMEEERRLFYVAITRAKTMLYLSGYEAKSGSYFTDQSSFLRDIGESLLDCINNSRIGRGYAAFVPLPIALYRIGDRVLHKAFGYGTVTGVDEIGQIYEIAFDELGQKRRIQFRAELMKV